jgi:hypothetical protein
LLHLGLCMTFAADFAPSTRSCTNTIFICIYCSAQVLLKSVANEGRRTGAAPRNATVFLLRTWSSLIQGLMARLEGRRAPGTAGRCRQATDTQLRPETLPCFSHRFSSITVLTKCLRRHKNWLRHENTKAANERHENVFVLHHLIWK